MEGGSEGVSDLRQYFFGILEYFVIPKAKHPNTFGLQSLRPLGIAVGLLRTLGTPPSNSMASLASWQ